MATQEKQLLCDYCNMGDQIVPVKGPGRRLGKLALTKDGEDLHIPPQLVIPSCRRCNTYVLSDELRAALRQFERASLSDLKEGWLKYFEPVPLVGTQYVVNIEKEQKEPSEQPARVTFDTDDSELIREAVIQSLGGLRYVTLEEFTEICLEELGHSGTARERIREVYELFMELKPPTEGIMPLRTDVTRAIFEHARKHYLNRR